MVRSLFWGFVFSTLLTTLAFGQVAPSANRIGDNEVLSSGSKNPIGAISNWSLADVPAEIPKIRFPVEKFKLKNGLTVLLAPDRTVPMVSYHTWYRVGSRNEQPGVTGAAHMLEHMMFKGAKKYSDKDFDRIHQANGIVNNAFTSYDYTGFFQNLPSSKLELVMDMELDRMQNLALKPEALQSELQVVGEERRWRVDNNPSGLLDEIMMSQLYTVHPYRWEVIGWMKDIQAYSVEKLRKFYDQFYIPNNAVLVIVGDIDVGKTKDLIEKYYGVLEAKPLAKVDLPQEPERTRPARKEVSWDVQSHSFMFGYVGVKAGNPDGYALDILSTILGGGNSSRLYRKLVYEKKMALGVASYNYTGMDPGAFNIMVTMKPGISTGEAESTVAQQIERLRRDKVSAVELQKAKNQTMKSYVDALNSIDGKARSLAVNEIMFNNYERLYEDLELYNKVTVEDVQRVAEKYLAPQRQVIAVLKPKR